MSEESKSSVSNLKAMFEANIAAQVSQPKPAPKKLQPSGVFGAQPAPASQPPKTTVSAGGPPKTTAPVAETKPAPVAETKPAPGKVNTSIFEQNIQAQKAA